MTIVKVQRPLSGGDGRYLVYAEGKSRMCEQPIPPAAKKSLGDDLKGYFNAHYSSIVGWAVNERVKDQSW
ncbi:hypothetical protein ACELLULO517_07505 [Acidisoma cellulosilytica]|uniref:Uncharacterized protein n=1 Tax=Acidisoma cellulosilyticum TaxID=2802395 RepID=A0A963Z024_9PROT|nr:hypothetical protein [Acidisoma cellulosilyticum]MCB8880076.1 hypothetical protein [Acidisoma cellulosilyticum]